MNLGLIYLGMGQVRQGDRGDESCIPAAIQLRVNAENRLGSALVKSSPGAAVAITRRACRSPEVDRRLECALKARYDANAGPTDPGPAGNVGDLATVLTETGKPADALKLLDPIIKAQTVKSGSGYARLIEAQLKALITSGNVEPAIAPMKALEQSGARERAGSALFQTRGFWRRSSSHSSEKRTPRAQMRCAQPARRFLRPSPRARLGQSYESLQWAGEGLSDTRCIHRKRKSCGES